MTNLPRVPDPTSPGSALLVQWARVIMRCIIERTIHSSPEIYVQEGPTGVQLRIKSQPGKGGGTSNDKPVWL